MNQRLNPWRTRWSQTPSQWQDVAAAIPSSGRSRSSRRRASSPELVIENDDSMVSSTATPSADRLLGIEDDDPDAVAVVGTPQVVEPSVWARAAEDSVSPAGLGIRGRHGGDAGPSATAVRFPATA